MQPVSHRNTLSGDNADIVEACLAQIDAAAATVDFEAASRRTMQQVEAMESRSVRFSRPDLGWLAPCSLALTLLLSFWFLSPKPSLVAEPSAVVQSVDGCFSSLMLLETPDSRQTIIWFEEAGLNTYGERAGKRPFKEIFYLNSMGYRRYKVEPSNI